MSDAKLSPDTELRLAPEVTLTITGDRLVAEIGSVRMRMSAELLTVLDLSRRPDCWFVKLDRQIGRHGMVRGRCFLTTPEAVAEVWRTYKVTDHVLCTVQDDDFTAPQRQAPGADRQ